MRVKGAVRVIEAVISMLVQCNVSLSDEITYSLRRFFI